MFTTENGTSADILAPAVKDAKHNGPYHSNFVCAVSVNRSADELYAFWRDFQNLPKFIENIEAITITGPTQSHWIVKGPNGPVEWDARISEDVPGKRIAWSSVGDADVDNAGVIEFKNAPEGRGTEVRVLISFKAPLGGPGRMIAGWLQKDPHIQAKRDLRRFKQLIETGEVATSPANQDKPAS